MLFDGMKSAFGFDPDEKMDPSARSVAEEWYMRLTVEVAATGLKRCPTGLL